MAQQSLMTAPQRAPTTALTNAAAIGAAFGVGEGHHTRAGRQAWVWYTGDIAMLAAALTEAEEAAKASTLGNPPYNETWPDFESIVAYLASKAGDADAMTEAQARQHVEDAIRESWK